MSNFLQDLEKVIGDEEVLAVRYINVRGETDYDVGRMALDENFEYKVKIKVVQGSWESHKHVFDYDYDTGYGGADCHAVLVWTPTRAIFVGEYDGATAVEWLPIAPSVDGKPKFI